MLRVIGRARRRLLANELLAQAANVLGAALLAFILLLLAGTELLRWEWLLLPPAATAAIGVYVALKRQPSPYTVAQIIDRRVGLADTLSTAWFFSRTESPRGSAGMLRVQREQAERISQTVDVRRAAPLKAPRSVYAVAALALLASSLFALRYGITRGLDLHPPLAHILEQGLGFERKIVLAQNIRRHPLPAGQAEDSSQDIAAQEPNRSGEPEASQNHDAESSGDRTVGKNGSGNRGDTQKKTESAERQPAAGEQDEAADQPENPSGSRSGDSAGQPQNRQTDRSQPSGAQRDANGSDESSSLLSKMKDAFQNLLSRVKPQQNNPGSGQSKDQGAGQQGKDGQNGGKQSAKDGHRGDGSQPGDSREGQSGDSDENSSDPRGDASGRNEGRQASKQPGAGIGSQDGDKSVKQAEQLAAMGKISEIIGKRSADLTGEATVEVQSTSQQLRTPYAQRGAEHAQGGAEIDRDEIPVGLEAYVEKYFEQVRKQAKK